MNIFKKIGSSFEKLDKKLSTQPTNVKASYENVETDNLKLVIREGTISIDKMEKIQKVMKVISLIIIYGFLALMAIVVILPFYWMIITSLKTNDEIRATTQTFWPMVVMWSNYANALNKTVFDFPTYLINTLIVGIISTLGTLITTIFAAFAFARLNFKGKDILFMILLATMMIPGEMMVITNYITVANFGWLNDGSLSQLWPSVDGQWFSGARLGAYLAMIVPFWVSVLYIYLLRQNFKQIPNELYLASKVDGKSDWNFLWKVMVPLSSPTLISIFILKLMGAWNSYVWRNLVADDPDFRLITNGLRNAFSVDGNVQYGYQMAATVVVTVPLLLLFIFFRKYIMKGVGRAGIKG
ncbi:MAG: carbohydrate ABC transporter permease [Acholeplasmataceae bacterium]